MSANYIQQMREEFAAGRGRSGPPQLQSVPQQQHYQHQQQQQHRHPMQGGDDRRGHIQRGAGHQHQEIRDTHHQRGHPLQRDPFDDAPDARPISHTSRYHDPPRRLDPPNNVLSHDGASPFQKSYTYDYPRTSNKSRYVGFDDGRFTPTDSADSSAAEDNPPPPSRPATQRASAAHYQAAPRAFEEAPTHKAAETTITVGPRAAADTGLNRSLTPRRKTPNRRSRPGAPTVSSPIVARTDMGVSSADDGYAYKAPTHRRDTNTPTTAPFPQRRNVDDAPPPTHSMLPLVEGDSDIAAPYYGGNPQQVHRHHRRPSSHRRRSYDDEDAYSGVSSLTVSRSTSPADPGRSVSGGYSRPAPLVDEDDTPNEMDTTQQPTYAAPRPGRERQPPPRRRAPSPSSSSPSRRGTHTVRSMSPRESVLRDDAPDLATVLPRSLVVVDSPPRQRSNSADPEATADEVAAAIDALRRSQLSAIELAMAARQAVSQYHLIPPQQPSVSPPRLTAPVSLSRTTSVESQSFPPHITVAAAFLSGEGLTQESQEPHLRAVSTTSLHPNASNAPHHPHSRNTTPTTTNVALVRLPPTTAATRSLSPPQRDPSNKGALSNSVVPTPTPGSQEFEKAVTTAVDAYIASRFGKDAFIRNSSIGPTSTQPTTTKRGTSPLSATVSFSRFDTQYSHTSRRSTSTSTAMRPSVFEPPQYVVDHHRSSFQPPKAFGKAARVNSITGKRPLSPGPSNTRRNNNTPSTSTVADRRQSGGDDGREELEHEPEPADPEVIIVGHEEGATAKQRMGEAASGRLGRYGGMLSPSVSIVTPTDSGADTRHSPSRSTVGDEGGVTMTVGGGKFHRGLSNRSRSPMSSMTTPAASALPTPHIRHRSISVTAVDQDQPQEPNHHQEYRPHLNLADPVLRGVRVQPTVHSTRSASHMTMELNSRSVSAAVQGPPMGSRSREPSGSIPSTYRGSVGGGGKARSSGTVPGGGDVSGFGGFSLRDVALEAEGSQAPTSTASGTATSISAKPRHHDTIPEPHPLRPSPTPRSLSHQESPEVSLSQPQHNRVEPAPQPKHNDVKFTHPPQPDHVEKEAPERMVATRPPPPVRVVPRHDSPTNRVEPVRVQQWSDTVRHQETIGQTDADMGAAASPTPKLLSAVVTTRKPQVPISRASPEDTSRRRPPCERPTWSPSPTRTSRSDADYSEARSPSPAPSSRPAPHAAPPTSSEFKKIRAPPTKKVDGATPSSTLNSSHPPPMAGSPGGKRPPPPRRSGVPPPPATVDEIPDSPIRTQARNRACC